MFFNAKSSDVIDVIVESLYPFTKLFLFPPPLGPWLTLSYSVSMSLTFSF